MDLLKNLLFRQTTEPSSRSELATKWKDLLKSLREAGESRPIRFLRYYLISAYDFDRVPTARSVFDWITKAENQKKLGYGSNPGRFAGSLLDAAHAYANFLQGHDTSGSESEWLQGINYQRTGVRQHLCLLLAARHLSSSAFDELCRSLETLVFVLAMTSVQWNEIEKALPVWCKQLRSARSKADVQRFTAENLRPMVNQRLDAFAAKLEDTSTVPDRLKRYLLASLTQYLEEQCGKGGGFDRYFKENLTIEHILPQSTTGDKLGASAKAWIKTFKPVGPPKSYVHQLGNLTLLHRTPNSAARDDPFKPTKLGWYKKCPYDLTRAMAEVLASGKGDRITKTVAKYGIHPYTSWSATSLAERHAMMLRMVEEYWGLELPGPSAAS
jgi:hypothetical protein